MEKEMLVVAKLKEGTFEKFMGFMQSPEGLAERAKVAVVEKTIGTVTPDKSTVMFKIFCTDEAALHKFIEGTEVSGFIFALDASPILPVMIAPISVTISPNRFGATMTSNTSGLRTRSIHAASMSNESDSMSAYSSEISSNVLSHMVMYPSAFDLVIDVTWFLLPRSLASSKAYLIARAQPFFVYTADCTATSSGVWWYANPPMFRYSPSVFSRITARSMS